MIALLAIFFGLSLLLTSGLVPWVARLAHRWSFLDLPGPRKVHTHPVAYGGGLAVAAGMLLTVAAGCTGAWIQTRYGLFPGVDSEVAAYAGGLLQRLPALLVCALGSVTVLGVGLVDDRAKVPPGTKLLVEATIALGVALGAGRLDLFGASAPLQIAVTVVWIVGVMNAFNLLDHMDGVSSGVAVIAGGAFLAVALQTGQLYAAAALATLVGSCAGFLAFNFPPARIFLGDAGSLFIGYWMSCLTVGFTFYQKAHDPLYTYLVPLAVLAVPLIDAALVVGLRWVRRRPLFEGDMNHLAHRLAALGMSPRAVVLTVYALTLHTGLAAVLLYYVPPGAAILVFLQLLLGGVPITLLPWMGARRG